MFLIGLMLSCTGSKEDTSSSNPLSSQCTTEEFTTDSFSLLPDVSETQIHADVASDGAQVWMVYNIPNEQSQFDVYLVAFGCDGRTEWGPQQILDIEGLNQTTPRIALSQDRILVAAQGDNGMGPDNLSIHLYVQDVDGTVIEEGVLWEPEIAQGNRWLPSIVGTENGFWIAAATSTQSHFRTAVQALELDASPRGSAHWVGPDSYAVFPNIDANDDQYIVGWETGEDSIQYVQGDMNGALEENVQTLENHGGVRVIFDRETQEGHVFSHQISPLQLQWNGEEISDLNNTFFPNVVRGDDKNFFAYYRLQGGTKNDLYYGFIADDGSIAVDNLLVNEPPAAPYRPALTYVNQNTYFVAWSQGENPDFELWGRFVTVEPYD